ncbi:MAG: asparagine--tRNA ligase [Candidatus Thermoplasmatota archaeon]
MGPKEETDGLGKEGFVDIEEILEGEHTGSEVKVRGWIHRTRDIGNMAFLNVRDPSGVVQATVAKDEFDEDKFEELKDLLVESSLKVKGEVAEDERAPGGYEIRVTDAEIVHASDDFPIHKDQSVEHLLDNRHLWLRSRRMRDILNVRSTVFNAIHGFFREEGYKEFQSPILTPVACEGGSTLFPVEYFDDEVYLTQSWQLYAEAAIYGLGDIYTIAPSFRAEKSRTPRHVTEFWHAEVEGLWLDNDELIELGEGLVLYIVDKVLEENMKELENINEEEIEYLKNLEGPFPRITYEEAVERLKEVGMDVSYGDDFGVPEEKKLTSMFDKPVFVTHYPKEIKAFYMKRDEEDPTKVLGYDLMVPHVGELIGGSVRETDVDSLVKRLEEQGEDPSTYDWFLDTRRYGSVPHAGFGLGIERLIMWILDLDHIRDAIAFPRTPNRQRP